MKKNIEKEILVIIEKICNLKKNSLTASTEIKKIKKWDSLNNIRIFIEIEKLTKKKIKPKEIYKINKIKDIISLSIK